LLMILAIGAPFKNPAICLVRSTPLLEASQLFTESSKVAKGQKILPGPLCSQGNRSRSKVSKCKSATGENMPSRWQKLVAMILDVSRKGAREAGSGWVIGSPAAT